MVSGIGLSHPFNIERKEANSGKSKKYIARHDSIYVLRKMATNRILKSPEENPLRNRSNVFVY